METHSRAFSLLGISVYWYGLIIAGAIVLAVMCAWLRERRLGLPKETTLNLSLIMLPVGIVCARAYYVAFTWNTFRGDLLSVFNIRQGGMAIYGGLIGGLVAAFIYARAKKISFLRVLDLFAPAVALAQAIGRWGNFMNQEAYGNLVTDPRLQFFPASVFIEASQSWHQATFFYESAWCFLTFCVLMVLEWRGKLKRAGDGFWLYVLLYAAERAVVEGLRTDSLMYGDIRVSQVLSLAALAVAALALIGRPLLERKRRPS